MNALRLTAFQTTVRQLIIELAELAVLQLSTFRSQTLRADAHERMFRRLELEGEDSGSGLERSFVRRGACKRDCVMTA
jgi:hypothetical protein